VAVELRNSQDIYHASIKPVQMQDSFIEPEDIVPMVSSKEIAVVPLESTDSKSKNLENDDKERIEGNAQGKNELIVVNVERSNGGKKEASPFSNNVQLNREV
jgi:hypothetical protein